MIHWTYEKGTWRGRSDRGVYYRLQWRANYWLCWINQKDGHPLHMGRFPNADEGRNFCAEHDRNAAGTVDRERGMNLSVR